MVKPRARAAAVAGRFYPAAPAELRSTIDRLLAAARPTAAPPTAAPPTATAPPTASALGSTKSLIAPHAGYPYSGAVAASAFCRAAAAAHRIRRVVVIGPSHFARFDGLATSAATFFTTPLGEVEVDAEAEAQLGALPNVAARPQAHAPEHCLEVELPFLQCVLGSFRLIPLLVGEAGAEEVGRVLDALWGGDETLVVVSSDLSHYHDYDTAAALDRATCRAIEELRYDRIGPGHACGAAAIRGLLWTAARRGLAVTTLDLRSSGDTGGPRDAVVGYGAWALG